MATCIKTPFSAPLGQSAMSLHANCFTHYIVDPTSCQVGLWIFIDGQLSMNSGLFRDTKLNLSWDSHIQSCSGTTSLLYLCAWDHCLVERWTNSQVMNTELKEVNAFGCIHLSFASSCPVPWAEKNTHSMMLPPPYFPAGKLLGLWWAVPGVLHKYHLEFWSYKASKFRLSKFGNVFCTVKLPRGHSAIKPRLVEGWSDGCLSGTLSHMPTASLELSQSDHLTNVFNLLFHLPCFYALLSQFKSI